MQTVQSIQIGVRWIVCTILIKRKYKIQIGKKFFLKQEQNSLPLSHRPPPLISLFHFKLQKVIFIYIMFQDANDNRPRGGGKLLGTGGGKLLRSEGGKLDELGELDGGGEKMMVYEDITSLCLPDVQSSSPDPSDPCSSTSYTVQVLYTPRCLILLI